MPNNNTQPVVFYGNMDNLAKAGLDGIPATFDEMLTAVDKLKAAGVETPIALAGQSLWPGLMWIEYLADRVAGPELFSAIAAGDIAKWEDPKMIEALGMITQLVKAGAFGPGFGSVVADANADVALIHTGRAGLLLQGAWCFGSFVADAPDFLAAGKLVYGTFPTVEGGAGDPGNLVGNPANYWSVSANASEEQQKNVIAYLNEAMFNDAYTEAYIGAGLVPVVTGAEDKLSGVDNSEFLTYLYKLVSDAKHFQLSWDQALPSAQGQAMLTNLGQLFLDQITAEQFSKTMASTK
ncbi:extracellular solute-binding protein [Tessaracoccus aquimaris]|uniref:extracellular solute-binding protein n=1 Tax=Tessaracoccus aquimaris TaxID=1332264 RepID=UPI002029C4DF|nr:extracellular solute-binding protein [Tessaracoccus aquimaris]